MVQSTRDPFEKTLRKATAIFMAAAFLIMLNLCRRVHIRLPKPIPVKINALFHKTVHQLSITRFVEKLNRCRFLTK